MGIYDRDYERDQSYGDSPGYHLGGERTWTTNLVILMGIIYLIQLITKPAQPGPGDGWFTDLLSLHADLPRQPWLAFQLISYGFLHSPYDIKHILFNCFGLWMFGRVVEQRYGKKEFLAFFLTAVAFAGLTWLVCEWILNGGLTSTQMLGASGGIAAVLILFCVNFPHQKVFIWGVLPMPAWVFALIFVGLDLIGASNGQQSNIAYTAHIGGVIFALVYFKTGWRLNRCLPEGFKMPKLGRRPSLRVHDPVEDTDDPSEDVVDNILRKIREHGQDSLTNQERRILEEASREYQKRRS